MEEMNMTKRINFITTSHVKIISLLKGISLLKRQNLEFNDEKDFRIIEIILYKILIYDKYIISQFLRKRNKKRIFTGFPISMSHQYKKTPHNPSGEFLVICLIKEI